MSTPETQALPPEMQRELSEGWKGLRIAGWLAIMVGIVAILVPSPPSKGQSP